MDDDPDVDTSTNDPDDEATPQTLIGISFRNRLRAQEFLLAAQRLSEEGHLVLEDAVMVKKDDHDNTTVQETRDLQAGRTALSGAMWTGLIGLVLGGPVGWIAGGAIGAGAGVITAKIVDLGISDEWVQWFRDSVRADTSTVALLVTSVDHDALVAEAARFRGGELVYANLPADLLDRISGALSDE